MDYSRFAHLYDGLVTFDADLPFFVEECLAASDRVLELMAGTGRVTTELVYAGLHPVCVDSSRDMLGRLASKAAADSSEIVCADVRDLPFADAFSIAILPFNSICELVSEWARHAALASVHAALTRGGRFICTLYNPAYRLKSVNPRGQVMARFSNPSGRGEIVLTMMSEYDATRGMVSGTQTFTTLNDSTVVDEIAIPIEFCLPSRTWFAEAVTASGFVVEALFGDYDRSGYDPKRSPYMIWCLRKGAA
jgi:SAM-dependent methyltransferase